MKPGIRMKDTAAFFAASFTAWGFLATIVVYVIRRMTP